MLIPKINWSSMFRGNESSKETSRSKKLKTVSIVLAIIGVLCWLMLIGTDVFDEQAFRWHLEYFIIFTSFLCITASTVIAAIRRRPLFFHILWGLISLPFIALTFWGTYELLTDLPHKLYSDRYYQFWDEGYYWKLYHGYGLVMNDAGGMNKPWGEVDSCHVVMYDSLGAMWVETWTSHKGKPYDHRGELIPIDPRFSIGDYSQHKHELAELLAELTHDSVTEDCWQVSHQMEYYYDSEKQ